MLLNVSVSKAPETVFATPVHEVDDCILLDAQDMAIIEQSHKDCRPISIELMSEEELELQEQQFEALLARDPSFDIDVTDLKCLRFAHSRIPSYNIGAQGSNAFTLPLDAESSLKGLDNPLTFAKCHVRTSCDFGEFKMLKLSPKQAREEVFYNCFDLAKCIKDTSKAWADKLNRLPLSSLDAGVCYDYTGWLELAAHIDELIEDIAEEFGGSWCNIDQLECVAQSHKIAYIKELVFLIEVAKIVKM